jgi:hypothetical protein
MTASGSPDFTAVHDRLKQILAPYRDHLSVTKDGAAGMSLEVPGLEGKPWGYVAGTRLGKRYVSYYLMAAYGLPDLAARISPELKRRMQGKSCFNFTKVDEPLMTQLESLTAEGVERYRELVAVRPDAR